MIIAICDDNEQDRNTCKKQLRQLSLRHGVEMQFLIYQSGEELLFRLQDAKNQPDVIYLDMRMEGISGDEIARQLRKRDITSELVFYTVSKDYYTSAFDVKALHYIVKGETTKEKFEEIFLQALETVKQKQAEYIVCSGAGEFRNIEIKRIRCFEVIKRIITVYYDPSEEFSFYSTIGKIELRLQDYDFIRIHRAYLVSLFHIRSISFKEVVMINGKALPVGRSYYPELKRRMAEYAGLDESV
ncbi:MAG: LytR/AlgR family response regulator transcription factor [Lachnospiraceae bacterium]